MRFKKLLWKVAQGVDHKLESVNDMDPLLENIGNNIKYVFLGEASHGTSEFIIGALKSQSVL